MAASSSNSKALEVWYVLKWTGDALPPNKGEVLSRGKRVVLDGEMAGWEFKSLVRRDNQLQAPLLLYYITEKQGFPRWAACDTIDATMNPWFLRVDVGDILPDDLIPKTEDYLEEQQWIVEGFNYIPSLNPCQVRAFLVSYAISMPAVKLESTQAMRNSKTLRRLYFPKVPTVGEFKARLHETEAHRVWKSWPIKYLDVASGAWLMFPLYDLRDDCPLSRFGTDKKVKLIFECPKNMISWALPLDCPRVPYSDPPPDDSY